MEIYIKVKVRDNFEDSLDMQQQIESEIKNDRWSWHKCIKIDDVTRTGIRVNLESPEH